MFKKNVFLVAAFIVWGSIFAQNSTDILRRWDVSNKFKSGVFLHYAKGCKAIKKYTVASESPGSGSLQVKIIESNLKSLSNIQLAFIFRGKIKKGTKYRIKISLNPNQACQIKANVIMHSKPWANIAKKAHAKVNLIANESKDIIIEFTPGKDFKNVRVPCIYLGKLKPGTELNIKSVVLEKVTS